MTFSKVGRRVDVVKVGARRVRKKEWEAGEGKLMNEKEPTGEIKRATKRRKSISNFAGKHHRKQRWTSRGDSLGFFILHLRGKHDYFALCFLIFPEMKTVWWILFYLPWCLSECSALASAVSWLKCVGDKWQSERNNETNHCSITSLYPLTTYSILLCPIMWRKGWTSNEFGFTEWMDGWKNQNVWLH